MQYSRSVYEAALRIRNLTEFAAFRDFLSLRLEQERDKTEQLNEDIQLRRAQGGAKVLKEILDLIESAPAVLDKMQQHSSNRSSP